ncbi:tyrosine-type recombinase/integrase [Hoeflea sp. G2-23]|uniref:Tyrosine-type recombinase/integrase n=1 Tax=Hoeflea algicola TaxID=2983763 RepID=A0ABT3Z791_9HYPH|nr:tyrosine-type recombinase/integrase [Hoeflea algicola]MCY0147645.1 tyrosine-type recombinase/integrase [Hoeflea algicola]
MAKNTLDFKNAIGVYNSGKYPLEVAFVFTPLGHQPPTPPRSTAIDLVSLWRQHAGVLWESGPHKDSCRAFIFEIHDFMVLQNIATYDDILIDKLVDRFRSRGNRNSTINRKLSALYRLLRKANRSGQIPRLPTYVRLRERNSRVRFLTAAEEAWMFHTIAQHNPHHELLCRFLVDTGARVGEALALKWNDIQGNTATFWITKSGKSRSVPLTIRAAQALSSARRFGGIGPFSTISYPNFKYNWNRARKLNNFDNDPHMVPHILRHTCASRLVQAGIDLRRVQSFLGHQTIQMTLRYAHLATDDLDQCAVALDAINSTTGTRASTTKPSPRQAKSKPAPKKTRENRQAERRKAAQPLQNNTA